MLHHALRSTFHAWKRQVLFSFFARLFLILIVLAGLGIGGVYYYFKQESAAKLDSLLKAEFQEFERKFSSGDYNDLHQRQKILSYVQQRIQESDLLRIEIRDQNGLMVIEDHRRSFPKYIDLAFDNLLPERHEADSLLLSLENGEVVLLYAKRVEEDGGYVDIKAILPLHADTVELLRDKSSTIVLFIVATLALVVVAIFPLIFAQYRQLNRDRVELLSSHIGTLIALGNAIAKRDSDTHDHNYRVTYYSIKLAEALGVESWHFPTLIKGAFLHDVGKIGIPDAILLKPAPLDEEEFFQMKRHVRLGLEIVKGVAWLEDAAEVIGYHHEKYDGTGYPRGVRHQVIPLTARIFTIADVFDALSSKRPYKEAFPLDKALKILEEGSGSHFDPDVLEAFIQVAPDLWQQTRGLDESALTHLLFEAIRPHVRSLMGGENLKKMKSAEVKGLV